MNQMDKIREGRAGFYAKSPRNREQSHQVISTPSILDTANPQSIAPDNNQKPYFQPDKEESVILHLSEHRELLETCHFNENKEDVTDYDLLGSASAEQMAIKDLDMQVVFVPQDQNHFNTIIKDSVANIAGPSKVVFTNDNYMAEARSENVRVDSNLSSQENNKQTRPIRKNTTSPSKLLKININDLISTGPSMNQ